MEAETQHQMKEILFRLAKLQSEMSSLKQKERKKTKITIIEESLAEVWDNKDDDVWNNY